MELHSITSDKTVIMDVGQQN